MGHLVFSAGPTRWFSRPYLLTLKVYFELLGLVLPIKPSGGHKFMQVVIILNRLWLLRWDCQFNILWFGWHGDEDLAMKTAKTEIDEENCKKNAAIKAAKNLKTN